jgi:hypothetical protein
MPVFCVEVKAFSQALQGGISKKHFPGEKFSA